MGPQCWRRKTLLWSRDAKKRRRWSFQVGDVVVRHWILNSGRLSEGERLEKAAKRKWDRGAGGGKLGCGVVTPRSVDDGASRLATLRGEEDEWEIRVVNYSQQREMKCQSVKAID